jgi:CheY-like chemotaxis protein
MKMGGKSSESSVGAALAPKKLSQRILVVDDDHDMRQLNVDVLTDFGYDVHAAKDGAAGWDLLLINRYDLVITDNQMPKMTGIEMIDRLRSAAIKTPVIMATGNLPVHEFTRRPWLYPNASLQRPFTSEVLLATVKKVLRQENP